MRVREGARVLLTLTPTVTGAPLRKGPKSRDRLTLDGYPGGGPEANDICALILESEDR